MTDQQASHPLSSRQGKLYTKIRTTGLDSIILNPGPSLVYLTGLHFHLSERPVVVMFKPDTVPAIVLPELEQQKLKQLPFEIQAFPYGEDPTQWLKSFQAAAQYAMLDNGKSGVEPRQLRFLEYGLLTEAAPRAKFISAEDSLSSLRMYKDDSELSAMRKAAEIAQNALLATLPSVRLGMSERELAAELSLQVFRAGSDPEAPFAPIVSSGLNSANPHAVPSERKLSQGDLLVIDWGASFGGYCSDITRTFTIGKPDKELIKIGQVVLEANIEGRNSVKPGIAAQQVDQAARRVIEEAGYGKYFTHRTGHGIGMEGHEAPYIREGNKMLLEPGMTFTVEPGIYLPGRNGVRIEDDVVVTADGVEILTSLPRELRQLA